MDYQTFKGRDFLTLLDYTPAEIAALLALAAGLKAKKKAGVPHDSLRGVHHLISVLLPCLPAIDGLMGSQNSLLQSFKFLLVVHGSLPFLC